jgi:hypothetical protein
MKILSHALHLILTTVGRLSERIDQRRQRRCSGEAGEAIQSRQSGRWLAAARSALGRCILVGWLPGAVLLAAGYYGLTLPQQEGLISGQAASLARQIDDMIEERAAAIQAATRDLDVISFGDSEILNQVAASLSNAFADFRTLEVIDNNGLVAATAGDIPLTDPTPAPVDEMARLLSNHSAGNGNSLSIDDQPMAGRFNIVIGRTGDEEKPWFLRGTFARSPMESCLASFRTDSGLAAELARIQTPAEGAGGGRSSAAPSELKWDGSMKKLAPLEYSGWALNLDRGATLTASPLFVPAILAMNLLLILLVFNVHAADKTSESAVLPETPPHPLSAAALASVALGANGLNCSQPIPSENIGPAPDSQPALAGESAVHDATIPDYLPASFDESAAADTTAAVDHPASHEESAAGDAAVPGESAAFGEAAPDYQSALPTHLVAPEPAASPTDEPPAPTSDAALNAPEQADEDAATEMSLPPPPPPEQPDLTSAAEPQSDQSVELADDAFRLFFLSAGQTIDENAVASGADSPDRPAEAPPAVCDPKRPLEGPGEAPVDGVYAEPSGEPPASSAALDEPPDDQSAAANCSQPEISHNEVIPMAQFPLDSIVQIDLVAFTGSNIYSTYQAPGGKENRNPAALDLPWFDVVDEDDAASLPEEADNDVLPLGECVAAALATAERGHAELTEARPKGALSSGPNNPPSPGKRSYASA